MPRCILVYKLPMQIISVIVKMCVVPERWQTSDASVAKRIPGTKSNWWALEALSPPKKRKF
jgi:hypothetical protein